jgi:hypothetical protein
MRTEPLHIRGGARRGVALAIALLFAALVLVIALGGGQAPAQELDRVEAKQDDLQAEIDQQNSEINSLIAQEAELREEEASVAEDLAAKQAELD